MDVAFLENGCPLEGRSMQHLAPFTVAVFGVERLFAGYAEFYTFAETSSGVNCVKVFGGTSQGVGRAVHAVFVDLPLFGVGKVPRVAVIGGEGHAVIQPRGFLGGRGGMAVGVKSA